MSKIIEDLYAHLNKSNYRAKIVSTNNLFSLINEIQQYHQKGLIEKSFFKERLSWLSSSLLKNISAEKSVIIIAVPRPQSKASFNWNGNCKSIVIPPTYTGYEQTRKKVENQINKVLKLKNYSATRALLPLKALAVRSGLGTYGKNNICYVSGMGSFHQLVAVYSNILTKEKLQKPKMMTVCEKCDICEKACPTNAISHNRFLLKAERCLTYHNEKKGVTPFPSWIEQIWHNCVVGCMYCQKVCPVNTNFSNWFGIEETFSEKETKQLLNHPTKNNLSSTTLEKLTKLNLADYLDSLSRNLNVFFR